MIRYSVFWRLSRALGRSIVAATVGMVLSAVAAPASAQITVGGNGGDTVDSTTYSGTQGLTKIGTNSVTLTGNNTYTGGTIVNQGMLTLGGGSDSSGSTGVGPYTIGNGSALRVTAAGFWFNGTPTFNFTSSGGGTIDSASGVNFILNGATTFTSAGGAQNQIVGAGGINTHTSPSLTFNVARGTDANVDLLLSTSIWNGGSITKIGTGILAMTGANSYAGSTTISAGTLQIGTGGTTGSLGSGAVVNNTSLVFNRSDNFTVANTMSGSGSLMKNGAGTVTLTGSNTATGGTTINAGMLTLAGGSDSPGSTSVGPYTIGSGATLRVNANQYWFNGTPTFTFTSSGGGTIDSSGTTNFIMANDALYTANGGARSQIVGAAGINLNGKVVTFNVARGTDATADLLVSTGIWNNGSITKTGSGILVLSGSNTYTGGTTINTGTLTLAGGSDSSGLTGVGPYTIGNGAALRVTAAGFWFNGTPTFNFTSSGGGTIDSAANANFILNGASTINSTGGAQNQITGPAGLNTHNGPTLTFNVARGTDANADVLVSAGIWNGGGITKNGNGILALTGANSYAGTTTISGGTLQIGNGGTTGALGSGAVVNNAALVFNRANALTVSAAISGSGTLVQCGLGTTTLSAQTTHTGGTIVEAGTLLLSGSDRLAPASSATVNSGGTLRLDGNQTLASIAGSGAITFGTSITGFTLTTGSVSSTFAGSISGMGYLWKVGPGTLTLTGSHSYIAGTVVAGGTLATVGNNVLPTSGNIAVNAGGTLLLGGNQTVSSAGGSGGVYNLNGYTLTMADAAAAFGGDTAGGGVLAKTGGGTWSIFGTTSGSTAVVLSGGSIKLMGNNRLSDSGAVTINGGTFDMNGFTDLAGSVTVNGGRIINGTLQAVGVSMNNGTVSGVLTGTGGFTKTSAGTVVISSTSSYTGETAIQGGTLETTGANRLSAASTMNVSAGGTFKMGGDQTLASVAGSGAINLGAGTLTTGSSSSTFAGSITGNGGLTKVGPGTLTLSGSNAFTGDTNLNGGTLVLASANALPTDAIVTMQSGATLQLSGTTVVGAIDQGSGTVTGGTLVASLVATQSGALDSVIADGEVNGTPFAAGILKRSAGTTTIGAANTFTGAIRLQGGTLQLTGSGGFDPASRLVMSSGATMDLNGKSQTFSALGGTGGAVALGSGQLTVNNAAGGVFAGVISGSGGVVKTGAGLLELTGASTYTGATAIDAGELKLNGSLASSSLALAAGATLSGIGSIAGNAVIAGIHMPGNSPGIQSVGGNLTYAAGSSVTWELTDNTAALASRGVEFDGINVGGNLAFLGTSLLNLAFNGSGSLVNWNDAFWSTDKAGANGWLIYDTAGTTSSLSGLAINGTDWLDGAGNSLLAIRPDASFALQQVGSDVYLTFVAVPEPSAYVLAGLGVAIAALQVRRRRGSAMRSFRDQEVRLTQSESTRMMCVHKALHSAATRAAAICVLTACLAVATLVSATPASAQITVGSNGSNTTDSTSYSGTQSLTKVGSNQVTLTGNNSYSGGTTVNAGTLGGSTGVAFDGAQGGAFGTGSITVNSGATIRTNSTFTLGGGNQTTRTVNLLGGTANITGAGTGGEYLRTINLQAGTITADNGSEYFRSPSGGFQINSLASATSSTIGTGIDLTFSSLVADTAAGTVPTGADLVISGNITENTGVTGEPAKSLTKNGAGTLVLSGNNSYSGGTVINAGTLRVGNGGSSGSLGSGNVANNAALVFDRTDTLTAANIVSGSGTVTKNGSGTVTLSGSNSYSGGTTVNAGTLTGSVGVPVGSSQGGSFGTGSITVNSGATILTGSTFVLGGGNQTTRTVNLLGGTANITGAGAGGEYLRTINLQAGTITADNGSVYFRSPTGGFQINSLASATSSTIGTGIDLTLSSLAVNTAAGTVPNGADLVISGNITENTGVTGEPAKSLTKNGAGTLVLSASNSYTGGTLINEGVVRAGNAFALGSRNAAATTVTVAAGATLDINRVTGNTGDFFYGVTIAGVGAAGQGALINTGTDGNTSNHQTPNITLSANARIGGSGSILMINTNYAATSLDLAGNTLTKVGTNAFILANTTVSAGVIDIEQGTLSQFNTGANASAAAITLADVGGVALTLNDLDMSVGSLAGGGATGGNVSLGSGRLTVGGRNETTSFGGVIAGTGGVIKVGTGTQALTGANTYSGTTTISAGTLQVGNGGTTGALGSGAVVTNATLAFNRSNGITVANAISGSGTLVQRGLGTTTLTAQTTHTGGTIVEAGTLLLSGANRLAPESSATVNAGGTLRLNGDQTLASVAGGGSINIGPGTLTTGSQSSTFAGSITGNGGLTKVGPGTLTLSGSNAFTGDTNLNGGTLVLASANALPTDAIVTMQSGATLQLSGTTVVGAIENNGGTISGGTLVASLVATQSGALDSVIADGEVNGTPFAAGILKRSAGTTTIGAANTFTGAIRLQGGTLQLSGSGSFDPASRLVMSSGATMDLNGKSQTFSALSGTGGTVALGSGQLTVNNAAGGVFAGVISGSGGVVKTGAGLLELTGASTYTGPTAIDAGELKLNGSLASSSLALAAGATLSGTGSIGGNATIAGIHMPGNSPGIQSVGGDLTYAAGSSVTWELTDNTAALSDRGVEFDGINVGGNLTFLGTSLLNLAFNGSGSLVNWNDPFWETDKAGVNGWLIYDTAGTTSSLSGLAINGTDWLDGAGNSLLGIRPNASFALQQVGSDVYLTFQAVPEPSTFVLVGIGLAGLALARRRM